MSISSRIKEAREKQGLSRAELAKKIGVSASSISNYENGISSPKDSVLYALIHTLHVDANFIFQDEMKKLQEKSPVPAETETGELSEDVQQLLTNYSKLNDEGKTAARDSVEALTCLPKYKKCDSSQELA